MSENLPGQQPEQHPSSAGQGNGAGGAPQPGGDSGQAPPPPPPASGYPSQGAYPGPPPGGYPGASAPGYPVAPVVDGAAALSYSWRALVNHLGPLAVIALAVVAVHVVLGVITRNTGSGLLDFILAIVSWVVTSLVAFGLTRAALAILDGRDPTLTDVFNTDRLVTYLLAWILFSVAVTLGLVLCLLPGLIAAFLLWFFGYAILDAPDVPGSPARSPLEALNQSFQVTSKRPGTILLIAIMCFALNLVGAILCGVGLIVTLPLTAIIAAYTWRVLTGGTVAPQQ